MQKANEKLHAIYRKKNGGRSYQRHHRTNEPMTIGLGETISRLGLRSEIIANIDGLEAIRNTSAHVGTFEPTLGNRVREFGSATIRNFILLSTEWFDEAPRVGYLLPVAFMDSTAVTSSPVKGKQRDLLKFLTQLSQTDPADTTSEYSVTLKVEVNLNRGLSGGGNIGITTDSSAPLVRFTDDEAVEAYPLTHKDVVAEAKSRYTDFSANRRFNEIMKEIKTDLNCAYERKLDPKNKRSSGQFRYRLETTFQFLDQHYIQRE